MIGGKKIVGVCITKLHEIRNINLLDTLHKYADSNNSKLIAFNSYSDFYTGSSYDDGAKAVYDVMNFDLLDAIVIYPMCFVKKEIVQEIIDKAKNHNVPVILIDEEQEGCYSVMVDYSSAFKSIINHVIKDHGAADTVFIAGNKDNDTISDGRIRCYREVLEGNCIAFSEDNVYYGGYWSGPVYDIIDKLVSEDRKLPQAIFCANDSMAIAVCERLEKHGYSVPVDTIVTGFDGIPSADYFKPKLTTCCVDNDCIASAVFDVMKAAEEGNAPYVSCADAFNARISESCGCEVISSDGYRDEAIQLFRTLEDMETLDDLMHSKTDSALTVQDINSLYETVSSALNENSYVCVSSDFLAIAMGAMAHPRLWEVEALTVISSKIDNYYSKPIPTYTIANMVPNAKSWVNDSSMYVLNSIYVRENACGVYAVKINLGDSMRYMRRTKRVFNAVNIAFNISANYFRHTSMVRRIEQVSLKNPTTGLPNLKGAANWFNEFAQDEKHHKGPLTVSVYQLTKYTYIYENFGVDDAEIAVRYSAEALKLANPTNCLVAHIADDEFAVINYYESYDPIAETINNATSMFYKTLSTYNDTCGKEYYIELSAGCFVIDPGWDQPLETYIRAANNEMYMNILRQGGTAAAREKSEDVGTYKTFEVLIEKNLFMYHFQPIVSAKTGDIYAYEALMRTDPSIDMNPFQVLETAKTYRKLYQIEKATVFNVMERVANNAEEFKDKKVFINTIPGYFLNDSDRAVLRERYGNDMERYFFELTETSSVSDDELRKLREFGGNTGQIAIDDFGAGHSNIVNLMRYTPQIIKLDRFLITDIHKDQNKQMFVRSTIDFAKMNGIKVLAEGVETFNEMCAVIDLGVDYIQGYYTGKPSANPIQEIDSEIKKQILSANPLITW